jgi:DNA gyrase subunit B
VTKATQAAMAGSRVQKASDDPPVRDDVLEGLTAVVTVQIVEPQFEGQTKEILGTPAATKIVADVVSAALGDWFAAKANKAQARAVLEKVATAAKTRRELRLKKETIRRKNALESSSMPEKLKDCRTHDLERSELFIIEGDSAAGTLKDARDSEYQALLPIRGKILNTLRATEKQMLDNAECAAIITAIGAGSGKSFDLDAIRYGKLIVLADADVDGSHIRCLLLTLCWRYMRPLLAAGRVYSAVPPLHRIELSGSRSAADYIYTYTEPEMRATIARLEAEGRKVREVQRYNGLGEMDSDQLAETTVELAHRRLRRMTVHDGEEAAASFDMCMGANVAPRRDFIVANALSVDRASLDI